MSRQTELACQQLAACQKEFGSKFVADWLPLLSNGFSGHGGSGLCIGCWSAEEEFLDCPSKENNLNLSKLIQTTLQAQSSTGCVENRLSGSIGLKRITGSPWGRHSACTE